MAKTIEIRITRSGERADALLACVGVRLTQLGGRLEQPIGRSVMVVFSDDRDGREARRLVRKQLDRCGEDWTTVLDV